MLQQYASQITHILLNPYLQGPPFLWGPVQGTLNNFFLQTQPFIFSDNMFVFSFFFLISVYGPVDYIPIRQYYQCLQKLIQQRIVKPILNNRNNPLVGMFVDVLRCCSFVCVRSFILFQLHRYYEYTSCHFQK